MKLDSSYRHELRINLLKRTESQTIVKVSSLLSQATNNTGIILPARLEEHYTGQLVRAAYMYIGLHVTSSSSKIQN